MPVNKDAYLRYRIIDQCLTNKQHAYPTKEYILHKIEEMIGPVSVSSLEKDLGRMRDIFDAPVFFDRNRKGYCYADPDFSLSGIPLTGDEITALDFSTAVLQVLKQTPLFRNFEGAIEKVISGYRVGKILGRNDEDIIQVESPAAAGGSQWIEPLYKAILEKQALEIDYKAFDRPQGKHSFSPYLLKEYRNRWYVAGFSNRQQKTIVLALDRIISVTAGSTAYQPDPSFNAREFFRYSIGITTVHDARPEKVILLFNHAQANYILTQPMHASQVVVENNDEGVRIELLVYITPELIMSILGYGASVKVLAPAVLASQVKEEAIRMQSLY